MAFPNNTRRTAKLTSNHSIPFLGLGIQSQLSPNEVGNVVKTALENGYRHIDASSCSSSSSLHENEVAIGNAMRESEVPRKEIFLTMSLPRGEYRRVEEAVGESLERLGMEYVDLILLDAVDSSTSKEGGKEWDLVEVWMAMQRSVTAGKVRSIGVRNFNRESLELLLGDERCTIHPSINHIPLHPSAPTRKLGAFNISKGIHTMAHLSQDSPLYHDPILMTIAKNKGKSVEQILLRWGLHRGWSVVPISNTTTAAGRVRTSFELDGWGLTMDEVRGIEGIEEKV